jgi:hypothetical protein
MKMFHDFPNLMEAAGIIKLQSYWLKGFQKRLVLSQNLFESR